MLFRIGVVLITCFFITMSGSSISPILISSDDEFDDSIVVMVDHEVSQLEDSPLKVICNEEHRYASIYVIMYA